MVKFTRQYYGSALLLGIESDTKENLIIWLNKLYNFAITDDTKPDIIENEVWTSHVLTNYYKLKRGFSDIFLNELQNENLNHRIIQNGKRESMLPIWAEEKANKFIDSIQLVETICNHREFAPFQIAKGNDKSEVWEE